MRGCLLLLSCLLLVFVPSRGGRPSWGIASAPEALGPPWTAHDDAVIDGARDRGPGKVDGAPLLLRWLGGQTTKRYKTSPATAAAVKFTAAKLAPRFASVQPCLAVCDKLNEANKNLCIESCTTGKDWKVVNGHNEHKEADTTGLATAPTEGKQRDQQPPADAQAVAKEAAAEDAVSAPLGGSFVELASTRTPDREAALREVAFVEATADDAAKAAAAAAKPLTRVVPRQEQVEGRDINGNVDVGSISNDHHKPMVVFEGSKINHLVTQVTAGVVPRFASLRATAGAGNACEDERNSDCRSCLSATTRQGRTGATLFKGAVCQWW